MYLIAINIM